MAKKTSKTSADYRRQSGLVQLNFTVAPEERDLLRDAAWAAGRLSLSRWARQVLLDAAARQSAAEKNSRKNS